MIPPAILAPRLNALRIRMVQKDPPSGLEVVKTIPTLNLFCNPSKVSPFPSQNANKAEIAEGAALTEDSVREMIAYYRGRDVPRFFFWLDPSPHTQENIRVLAAAGFRPFEGTRYHVLTRPVLPVELPEGGLKAGRVEPGTEPFQGCFGNEEAKERFRKSMGTPGIDHFAASCDGAVVATARLFHFQGLAYFCDAGTEEAYRGRGGQTGLIALRINRAVETGSTLCVVETLALLRTSLGNLLRMGFRPGYERVVYEFGPAPGE